MLIFQRYIVRELTAPVLMSVLFFTFIMVLRQLFEMAELLLEARVGGGLFFQLLGIITVSLILLTIPMAVLLGVLIGIGRLTSENEILAMRVSGCSIFRVFFPLVVLGFVGAGGLMYAGFYAVPRMVDDLMSKQSQIEFELLTALEAGRNYDEFSPRGTDLYLYFDKKLTPQPGDKEYTLRMESVAMRVVAEVSDITGGGEPEQPTPETAETPKPVNEVYSARGEQETLFFARYGKIEGDLATKTLTVSLEDGTIIPLNRMMYRVDGETNQKTPLYRETPERHTKLTFESMVKTIRPEQPEDRDDKIEPRRHTIDKLYELTKTTPSIEFWRDQKRGRVNGDWKKYVAARNEIFSRWSLPFSLPAFILIAIPLAVELRPRAKSVSFLIAIALILVYYVLLTWAAAVGSWAAASGIPTSPLVPLAYMSPNILIGGIGLLLLWRVERQ